MAFELTTERLLLREMNVNDLDFVAEMLQHPNVMEYYPKLYSWAEAEEWIDRQIRRYERDGHGLWLVQENDNSLKWNRASGECFTDRPPTVAGSVARRPRILAHRARALQAQPAVSDSSILDRRP